MMANVVVRLFNESGMSIREFATAAGLKYSTAHDIVTGKAKLENVGAGAFVRIAHVFNTTADALISGIGQEGDPGAISPDEHELVSLWRRMDQNQRQRILADMRDFALANDAKKEGDGRAEKTGTLDAVR